MGNFLNRTTKQYVASGNTPDFPVAQWIQNPDLSAVAGFESKYWTIAADTVTLMSAPQRAAVDAADLSAKRDAAAAALQSAEDILRAFMLLVLDELNLHAAKHNAILAAIAAATSLADFKVRAAAIPDYPARTEQQLRDAIRAKLGS